MDNYPFLSFQFFLFFFLFWCSVYVSWYLPGRYFLGEKEENPVTHLLLSLVIGIALWGVQGYIFGYLHVRFLTYLYLLFFLYYYWHRHKKIISTICQVISVQIKKNILIVLLLLVGLLLQLLPIANSGFLYADGVHLVGVNAVDGVMHLAFIRSMQSHFPPVEPGAFDHALTNYHYWSDLIISELTRVWHLPISHTFFQYLPIFISLFTGIAAYKVVRIFGFSKVAGYWSIFFTYFAADASYLLILLVHKQLNFSAPAIDNGLTQFLNMPHAMAKLVFLTSLIPLHYFLKTKQTYWGIVTVLLFTVLVGIKIYFGLFAIIGLSLIFMIRVIKNFFIHKKASSFFQYVKQALFAESLLLVLLVLLALGASLIYFPPNKSSGGLGYYPLEWAKIFIGPGVLNWGDWFLRHQENEAHHNLKGLAFLDGMAILITLISIHGTRLLGLIPSKRVYQKLGWEKLVFFFPGIVLFHILGLYTMQVSGGLNVFNFFVVSTVVMSLFASMLLETLSFKKNILWSGFIILCIVVMTVPRIINDVQGYLKSYTTKTEDTRIVNTDELEAFAFIRKNTPKNAIIQSHPTNPYDYKTPYVSYFSNRLTYLTGVSMQETHNQPLQAKKEMLAKLFNSNHPQTFVTDTTRQGITYLYIRKVAEEKLIFPIDTNLLNPVFQNKSVVIYKLQL